MADEMTRQEFTDYMTAFEQRLDARFAHIDQQFAHIDQQFAHIDQQFVHVDQQFVLVDQRFAQVDQRFAQVDQRFAQVHQQFTNVDRQFAGVGQQLTGLKENIAIQFEDVRQDIRFSLEAVSGLREVTERGFDDMRREHADQTSLLQDAVRHVRRRVDTVEPPRARTKPRPPSR